MSRMVLGVTPNLGASTLQWSILPLCRLLPGGRGRVRERGSECHRHGAPRRTEDTAKDAPDGRVRRRARAAGRRGGGAGLPVGGRLGAEIEDLDDLLRGELVPKSPPVLAALAALLALLPRQRGACQEGGAHWAAASPMLDWTSPVLPAGRHGMHNAQTSHVQGVGGLSRKKAPRHARASGADQARGGMQRAGGAEGLGAADDFFKTPHALAKVCCPVHQEWVTAAHLFCLHLGLGLVDLDVRAVLVGRGHRRGGRAADLPFVVLEAKA